MFVLNDLTVNNLFCVLVVMGNKKSLITTMTEKEVEDVNRFARIVLISMMMLVIWFTIQEIIHVTLNYQIHDMIMGIVCFVFVYLFYDKLRLRLVLQEKCRYFIRNVE